MSKCFCCCGTEKSTERKAPYLGVGVPYTCCRGMDFVYEMFAKGRLSTVEFDVLRNAIWPVEGGWDDRSYLHTRQPILQIIPKSEKAE